MTAKMFLDFARKTCRKIVPWLQISTGLGARSQSSALLIPKVAEPSTQHQNVVVRRHALQPSSATGRHYQTGRRLDREARRQISYELGTGGSPCSLPTLEVGMSRPFDMELFLAGVLTGSHATRQRHLRQAEIIQAEIAERWQRVTRYYYVLTVRLLACRLKRSWVFSL